MNDPQIIMTPAGEELADIRVYDRSTEHIAKGQDEMVPAEFANRILDGESAVRVWREYRKLSVKELAGMAGISTPYLSQIEGGIRAGSLPTMKALAEALRLDLDELR